MKYLLVMEGIKRRSIMTNTVIVFTLVSIFRMSLSQEADRGGQEEVDQAWIRIPLEMEMDLIKEKHGMRIHLLERTIQ